ncbi:MAG: hypothetical protein AABY75_08425, partial [Bacteroidota bacterium]
MTFLRRTLPVLFLLSLFSLSGAIAQAKTEPSTDKAAALIAEGDELATKKFDNSAALAKFDEAYAITPNNVDLLIFLSRTYVDIGEHLPAKTDAEKQEQLKYYERSLDYANKAIAANPAGSMGYTRRAIANGRVALFRGVWESLDLVKQVKADIEKALGLDVKNATAHYIMARTHAKV